MKTVRAHTELRRLKSAAAKNHDGALLFLARNYYYGYGVKRNVKKAFLCWEKGEEIGSAEAAYYLGLCFAKGIYVKQNPLKAREYLTKALENGFTFEKTAIDDIGFMCA